jgi:hypothetical protein
VVEERRLDVQNWAAPSAEEVEEAERRLVAVVI